MRLLQLTSKPPYPPRDGGALAAAQLLEMWQALGWQAEGLTMHTPSHPFDPKASPSVPLTAVVVHSRPTLLGAGLNLLSRYPYHLVRFQSPAYAKALQQLVERFQPNLIQVESLYLTPYVANLSVPCVYRVHNIESQIWLRHSQQVTFPLSWYLRLQGQRIARYEAEAIHRYAGLLCISEKEADWARAQDYTGVCQVLPFAVEIERYPVAPLGNPCPKIGFLGSLEWLPNRHGLEWFLRQVWPTFRRWYPEAKLSIAGRNPPAALYRYADSSVQILGEIPDAQAFWQAHEIIVVPLFSGSGIRVKVIEAFAAGRAVIATPLAAESLMAQPGRHFLLATDARSFAEALAELYTDPLRRKELGQAARHLAETTYNRRLLQEVLRTFYETLLGK
ncbi:MAG: glycosyltransferase family 4 protein [Bacteroidia bacterium]|nr:glycosyltransferase family 4 protein [Bacteroidia bacterium]